MYKLKKNVPKKLNNLSHKISEKSIGSDNLHVPLTSSVFLKIKPSVSKVSTVKSISGIKREKYIQEDASPLRLPRAAPAEVPKNVAVHFASFYQEQKARLPHSGDEKPTPFEKGSRNSPKMEFTRQMVYKLEHSAGTQNYGRQVSALLENTVESPEFDLKLPPPDNCAPQFGKSTDYFPLWYRDPSKMPFQLSRNQEYPDESKNEWEETAGGKGRGERKTSESLTSLSTSSNTDTEVKLDTETESEEVGMSDSRRKYDGIIGRTKSHLSSRSSRSSRSRITRRSAVSEPRGKRLGNSRMRYVVGSKSPISDSFSEHGWSTQTSRDRGDEEAAEKGAEEEEEKEDEVEEEANSIDWETTEDEDASVEVKVVDDLQKIGSRGGRKISTRL